VNLMTMACMFVAFECLESGRSASI